MTRTEIWKIISDAKACLSDDQELALGFARSNQWNGKGKDQRISCQIETINEYAGRHQLVVPYIWTTGFLIDDPLDELLRAAEKFQAKHIIANSPDRLFRNFSNVMRLHTYAATFGISYHFSGPGFSVPPDETAFLNCFLRGA